MPGSCSVLVGLFPLLSFSSLGRGPAGEPDGSERPAAEPQGSTPPGPPQAVVGDGSSSDGDAVVRVSQPPEATTAAPVPVPQDTTAGMAIRVLVSYCWTVSRGHHIPAVVIVALPRNWPFTCNFVCNAQLTTLSVNYLAPLVIPVRIAKPSDQLAMVSHFLFRHGGGLGLARRGSPRDQG